MFSLFWMIHVLIFSMFQVIHYVQNAPPRPIKIFQKNSKNLQNIYFLILNKTLLKFEINLKDKKYAEEE